MLTHNGYLIQKKRNVFVKNMVKKQPGGSVDHVTGDKIPKSFVFSRGKLPAPLRQLQMDLRKLMLPFTALKLKVNFGSFDIRGMTCSQFGLLHVIHTGDLMDGLISWY